MAVIPTPASPALAGISAGTALIAASRDVSRGEYGSAALNLVGAGIGAKGLASFADEAIQGTLLKLQFRNFLAAAGSSDKNALAMQKIYLMIRAEKFESAAAQAAFWQRVDYFYLYATLGLFHLQDSPHGSHQVSTQQGLPKE